MAGTDTATFLHAAQCNVTRWCRRWTAEEKDRAQRSPGAGSLARGPLRCYAAAGVVNQAVTSRRTATSQHQGRTAPHFDHRLEKSSVSCGQARDVEHLLAASTQAQTCKGNQVLNSYLGTSLPLKSEIEVRPLNISVGLAPKPCIAVQCRASAGTGQHCQQYGHCPFTCRMNVKEQEAFLKLWKRVKKTPLHAPRVLLPDSRICGPCL
ncbi:uncharacterized protein LOC128791209 [Vidua chalybeata]|uniref:uncharacterized protein LOC128791209 n=1 Tax=Vidua chalybeata TaxID=81927 RepID=UPI0023A8DEE8|nr:uncharacterized protein LOC128791209 [Vidua chalybeata]